MLTNSRSAAPATLRQQAVPAEKQQPTGLLKRLRGIASLHQVCYEVWPIWSTSNGNRRQIGFKLLLCGVNGHVIQEASVRHPVIGCRHCLGTYCEMREIAEWIVAEERSLRHEIQTFDHHLHLAPPERQCRCEIVVSTTILHRADFEGVAHKCEIQCLKGMRERLSKLGIRENLWRKDAS